MSRQLPIPASDAAGRFAATHGRTETPEYKAWGNAIYRCENAHAEQWADYGGRGIEVDTLWRADFEAFLSHMGTRPSPAHSLERIDVNGNYAPGNCCWATAMDQANNRRNTVRVEGLSLRALSDQTGLPITTVRNRVKRGWSAERIVNQVRREYPETLPC